MSSADEQQSLDNYDFANKHVNEIRQKLDNPQHNRENEVVPKADALQITLEEVGRLRVAVADQIRRVCTTEMKKPAQTTDGQSRLMQGQALLQKVSTLCLILLFLLTDPLRMLEPGGRGCG